MVIVIDKIAYLTRRVSFGNILLLDEVQLVSVLHLFSQLVLTVPLSAIL